ncbi:hypothetical protein T09_8924 [Trichinella sp. T9]|nr:hypothetical protein T09_8924 [Trichinella sp. T9]
MQILKKCCNKKENDVLLGQELLILVAYVEFLNSSYRKISRHSGKHRFTIMRYVGDTKSDAWC